MTNPAFIFTFTSVTLLVLAAYAVEQLAFICTCIALCCIALHGMIKDKSDGDRIKPIMLHDFSLGILTMQHAQLACCEIRDASMAKTMLDYTRREA